MDFKLYVSSESDDEEDFKIDTQLLPTKRNYDETQTLSIPSPGDGFVSDSDQDTDSDSDSLSDWEDVPLREEAESFNITINPSIAPKENIERQRKLIQRQKGVKERKRKVSIRYLGIMSFLVHAFQRNSWMNSKKVQKKLKKKLPKVLIKRSRHFWKSLHDDKTKTDEKDLVYILKYAVKWFRLNFRVNGNGIRVLGYILSKDLSKNIQEYQVHSSPISTAEQFAAIASKLEHNRDTGAQLFTCILRILGFSARLVFSLPLLPLSRKNDRMQPKLDRTKLEKNKDNDLLYPYFWTEVINPLNEEEIFVIDNICFHDEAKRFISLRRTRDPGCKPDLATFTTPHYYPIVDSLNSMTMHYVVSLTEFNTIFESSSRYMPDVAYRWFEKLDLRTFSGRSALYFHTVIRLLNNGRNRGIDKEEMKALAEIALLNCSIPVSISGMKRNPNVITKSTLRYNEVIDEASRPLGKILIDGKKEAVYLKNCINVGKSEQQWKLLGRSIIDSQIDSPIKVTLKQVRTVFKRRRFNFNIIQGEQTSNNVNLYSFAQTCKYIPQRVTTDENNVKRLPRNKYGNIEIFKDWMKPEGCSWLKMKYIEEALKDKVDHVAVVTGFDFSVRPGFAVPIKDGVLVLEENEVEAKKLWFSALMQWKREEQKLRELKCLKGWKLLIKGLNIKSRLDTYEA